MTVAVATDLTAGTWAIDPVHSSISISVRHFYREPAGSDLLSNPGPASIPPRRRSCLRDSISRVLCVFLLRGDGLPRRLRTG